MKRYPVNVILLVVVLLTGAFLRLYQYHSWSLTNDELSAIYGLSLGSLYNNITSYVYTDFHPAGVQVMLWFWTKIFGISPVAVRFPFVLMGIFSLALNYKIARKWFNKNVALLTTATLAVSQYAILYSQLARPYSSGLFFILLTLYGWSGIVLNNSKKNPTLLHYSIFTSGLILCMYNHYFSFLLAGIIGLTGLFLVGKEFNKKYILCGIIAIFLFLPHIQITLHQISAGGLSWLGKPDSDYFKNYFKYIFNGSKFFLGLIVIIALMAAIKLPLKLSVNKFSLISLLWFTLPLLVAYFYSVYVSPVLQHSILLFSFPFLLFFIFSFTPVNQNLTPYLVGLILIIGVIQVRLINHFNGSNEFARFKEIAQHISDADNKYGVNNISHAINIVSPFYINYYLRDFKNSPTFLFNSNAGRDSIRQVVNIVNNAKTQYFLYCWTNANCPYEINQIIKQKYPYLVEKHLYFNSEYYLYSSLNKDKAHDLASLKSISCNNYEKDLSGFSINKSLLCDTCYAYSGRYAELLTAKSEYSSSFKKEIKNVISNTADLVNVTLMVKTASILDDAQIVIALDNENQNYFWSGMNIKYFVQKAGEWTKCYFSIRLPQLKTPEDIITIYLLNHDKKQILIDDFCVEAESGNVVHYGLRADAWMNEKLLGN